MTIEATVNIKSALRFLKGTKDQIPFITSVAINEVAKKAQKAQRDRMSDKFIIRRPRFMTLAVKLKPFANKRSLKAVISIDPPGGQKNDFFSRFEEGDDKTAVSGRLAIPTSTIRPNERQIIPRSKRPRRLKRAFELKTRTGKTFIAQVKGRGKSKRLTFPFLLTSDSVPSDRRLELESTVQKVVFNQYEDEFAKAFKKVMSKP